MQFINKTKFYVSHMMTTKKQRVLKYPNYIQAEKKSIKQII